MKKRIFIGPIVFLLIWIILSLFHIVNPLFLPSPLAVLKTFFISIFSGDIIPDILFTLYRMIIGFFLSAIIGIPIGLLMGYSDKVYGALEFLVDFFRSIPALALFPLFLLFLGIGDSAKIGVVVFACFFVVLINAMYGVKNANKTRIMASKTMGANNLDIFRKIIFWDALPDIVTGLRISLSMSLLVVIVTEMFLGTEVGLGHRIYDAHLIYRIPEMYVSIILVGLLGYLLNKLFVWWERRIIHWAGK